MSLLDEYTYLEIYYLKVKTQVMTTLASESGFVDAVMKERKFTKSYKQAFDNINKLHEKLFTSKSRFKTFEQFKKEAIK